MDVPFTAAALALALAAVSPSSAQVQGEIKGKVLVVMSGAHLLEMPENKVYATGYYLNELATPLHALVDAGYVPVFASPNGDAPTIRDLSVHA